ncbi:MAG: tetratricopeptide repeat protein [Xanthomonadaceae bacterium]|nr:tetratricopeptide repeat protein [Xanthomonadaceae bacterium]
MRVEPRWWHYCSLMAGALALTWVIYSPGLHGEFLFDDFANLPALGSTGPITHWDTFFRYITSGTADPTGRPLTLLSFLLDGHDWPTAAYPFKRTNVLLHLLNGALLSTLLWQLGRRVFNVQNPGVKRRLLLASTTSAALWLVHPLFVSTVLYVVQREAMLPMTFIIMGLLCWLKGRDRILIDGRPLSGASWIVAGLAACTALATLSKANGILLPLYVLVTEYILLRNICTSNTKPPPSATHVRLYGRLLAALAWLPTIAIAGYLADVYVQGTIHGVERPWTIGQRLITEPRVIFDYLKLLWVPRPFTPGLFNDQIEASQNLLTPLTTIVCLAGLATVIFLSWKIRKAHPIWAFSILFFLAGQLLESSSIPLELYFEHRNYIPAMFMFWPLSLWLWSVETPEKTLNPGKVALTALLLAGLSVMTYVRADLWGNGGQQALLWATLNPHSARAQANAADYEITHGEAKRAEVRLRAALKSHPDDPQITLNILSARCMQEGLSPDDISLAESTLEHFTKGDQVIFHWLERAIQVAKSGGCHGLTNDTLERLLDATARNPRFERIIGREQDLDHLRGLLALNKGDARHALDWFNRGLAMRPNPQLAFDQAALLGSAGHPAEGLAHLALFESYPDTTRVPKTGMPALHAWVLARQGYWHKELIYLRHTLTSDLEAQQHP